VANILLLDHLMNVTIPENKFLIFTHFTCSLHLSVIFVSAVVITETIQVAVPSKP
jgi:hypothetical protein